MAQNARAWNFFVFIGSQVASMCAAQPGEHPHTKNPVKKNPRTDVVELRELQNWFL
jgi:hypothetical protein